MSSLAFIDFNSCSLHPFIINRFNLMNSENLSDFAEMNCIRGENDGVVCLKTDSDEMNLQNWSTSFTRIFALVRTSFRYRL